MFVWLLKQIRMVKKLNKWVPLDLTEDQKKSSFEVLSSLTLCNNEPVLNQVLMCNEKWSSCNNQWLSAQCLDYEDAPKHFPKPNFHQKMVYLVVCCLSDPLKISESQRNHHMWEVCSANGWDVLTTAMAAASIGQLKGPSSSPWQRLTMHHKTNASKTEGIGLQKFRLTHCVHLTSRQPTATSSSVSTTFCREDTSTTRRRQKMLSKSSSNTEAWVFMLQE